MDLPFLDRIAAGGREYFYYRRHGIRVRLKGEAGSPEFLLAYQAAHQQAEQRAAATGAGTREGAAPGSMAALIAAYRASEEWADLRPATRVDYEKALRPFEATYGRLSVAGLKREHVFRLRDAFARKPGPDGAEIRTPRRANRIVSVLSLLMSWAVDRGWRETNPALRPRRLKTGAGWRAWTADEITAFLAAPVGTEMHEALLVALYTGQRGGDQIAMTWAAYDAGTIAVVQGKTGIRLAIPAPRVLRTRLDTMKRRAVTILTRPDGQPWRLDHFRHAVGAAIAAAGLPRGAEGCVWHGLRRSAVNGLLEAGCTIAEVSAITGQTLPTVERYAQQVDRSALGRAAIRKLEERGE